MNFNLVFKWYTVLKRNYKSILNFNLVFKWYTVLKRNYKFILNFNLVFKWYTVLKGNYKFVTLHDKCSENSIVNVKTFYISRAKIACCSSELIFTLLYPSSSIENASEQFVSSIHLSFVNFALHPNLRKKN